MKDNKTDKSLERILFGFYFQLICRFVEMTNILVQYRKQEAKQKFYQTDDWTIIEFG